MERTYPAQIVRIVDGDTVVLDVDLGFNVWQRSQSFRLAGCNAREHNAPGGVEAAANLATMLPPGTRVTLTSVRPDKFGGRYDARLALVDGRDVAQILIETGWAAPWSGAGPKPVPGWPRPDPWDGRAAARPGDTPTQHAAGQSVVVVTLPPQEARANEG